jgi:hypothetical protein
MRMLSDKEAVLCLTQVEEAVRISELPEINVTPPDFLPFGSS